MNLENAQSTSPRVSRADVGAEDCCGCAGPVAGDSVAEHLSTATDEDIGREGKVSSGEVM